MQTTISAGQISWWREREIWILVLFVAAAYSLRLDALTIRGEESRRICIAQEMLAGGDWIVPHEQGEVFAERPPLANWLLAGLMWLAGNDEPWLVRMPSVVAIMLTVMLIYAYSRTMMSRLGALAAAAGYASMLQVMQLGTLAENDALLTLWLTAAYLFWHWGYAGNWAPWQPWALGYGCAGVAWLTKGIQGPVYFGAAVVFFLLWKRDWRYLFSRPHLLGIAVLLLVIGVWQVPFSWAVGWDAGLLPWTDQVTKKMEPLEASQLLLHLATYPFWIWCCMFPWSILLLAYASRRFRAAIGSAGQHVAFLTVCIAIAFPSVWIAASARSRYFMPLYPCFAVLCGLVLERAYQAAAGSIVRRPWPAFFAAGALFIAGSAAAAVGWSSFQILKGGRELLQPYWFISCFVAASLALALVCWKSLTPDRTFRASTSIAAIVAFWALLYFGLIMNVSVATSGDVRGQVAELKRSLPRGTKLVSFGIVYHLFRYHFHDQIERRPLPAEAGPSNPDFEYFCFNTEHAGEIHFPWKEVAVVPSSDRKRQGYSTLTVGQRLPDQTARKDQPATSK